MQVFNGMNAIPSARKGQVIAIGNFDGVHLGHHALLEEAKKRAQLRGLALGVLTFEPHPRKLFRPDEAPFRITPALLKHARLAEAGVDFVVSLEFNWDFASQSAESFVQDILKDGLDPAHVVIGKDFRFGQLRKGSAQTIRDIGIETSEFGDVCTEAGERYSSTAVRQFLRSGDIEKANRILGWRWEMQGPIFRGDRRGHELGYPTANVLLGDVLHPSYGVYATFVRIEGEDLWRMAATNIGIRPMFELKEGQIEAHILDFEDRDIYDKILTVRPIARLRGEAKFNSLAALIAQMGQDCQQVRDILSAAVDKPV